MTESSVTVISCKLVDHPDIRLLESVECKLCESCHGRNHEPTPIVSDDDTHFSMITRVYLTGYHIGIESEFLVSVHPAEAIDRIALYAFG